MFKKRLVSAHVQGEVSDLTQERLVAIVELR